MHMYTHIACMCPMFPSGIELLASMTCPDTTRLVCFTAYDNYFFQKASSTDDDNDNDDDDKHATRRHCA